MPKQTGHPYWRLDNLKEKTHYLDLYLTAGNPTFDYFIINPTPSTDLTGEMLILDDADGDVRYDGNWTSVTNSSFETGVMYRGTGHGSTRVGDSIVFQFEGKCSFKLTSKPTADCQGETGSSISVYGVLNTQSGRLSSAYSIDGNPPIMYTPFDGSQTVQPDVWTLNQRFFHSNVTSGQHTLTVTVQEVTGLQVRSFSMQKSPSYEGYRLFGLIISCSKEWLLRAPVLRRAGLQVQMIRALTIPRRRACLHRLQPPNLTVLEDCSAAFWVV